MRLRNDDAATDTARRAKDVRHRRLAGRRELPERLVCPRRLAGLSAGELSFPLPSGTRPCASGTGKSPVRRRQLRHEDPIRRRQRLFERLSGGSPAAADAGTS